MSSYIGAKDGIYCNSDWYHTLKVHSTYLSIILVVIYLLKLQFMHIVNLNQTHGSTYVGELVLPKPKLRCLSDLVL